MDNSPTIQKFLQEIHLPDPQSHKGQNGKLLIIGGSNLFHTASKWSLDIASKFVDMVFYASTPLNNQLIQEAKLNFWNGIVVPREELETYINEADCILIGPGMERTDNLKTSKVQPASSTQTTAATAATYSPPTTDEWQFQTEKIVNYLLAKYPHKKWVIDAGALQMLDPNLLNANCIITPHLQELNRLIQKLDPKKTIINQIPTQLLQLTQQFPTLATCTILFKGPIDYVLQQATIMPIPGGNAGMTKGGTGDVLAGLVAALYCQHQALTSAVVASYINKQTGDELFKTVGPFFNTNDLIQKIPEVFWQNLSAIQN